MPYRLSDYEKHPFYHEVTGEEAERFAAEHGRSDGIVCSRMDGKPADVVQGRVFVYEKVDGLQNLDYQWDSDREMTKSYVRVPVVGKTR